MSDVFIEGSDIDKDEYSIRLDFDRRKGKKIAAIYDGYVYRRDFRVGDVVTIGCEIDFGYVYWTKEDKVKVDWGYINEWEYKNDLIIIPPEYGRDCLGIAHNNNNQIGLSYDEYLGRWFKHINGYSNDSNIDDDYLVLGENNKFNIVNFIKYLDEKHCLVDTKLNRKLTLYKDFDKYSLYKTKLFRGDDFDRYQNAFYILDKITKKVYFGGIQDEVRKTLAILYNLNKDRD